MLTTSDVAHVASHREAHEHARAPCARSVCSNRASAECIAWIGVRVSGPTATASAPPPTFSPGVLHYRVCVCVRCRVRGRVGFPGAAAPSATASDRASKSDPLEDAPGRPSPTDGSVAASRWPRLGLARSTPSRPSTSHCAGLSVDGSSPRSSAPEQTERKDGSTYGAELASCQDVDDGVDRAFERCTAL